MPAAESIAALKFRRPAEADHPSLVSIVDEWWGGRRIHPSFPRLWLQHFNATSWLAEIPDGRPAGFLIGFISPEDPTVGYVHLIATNPNLRRRGLGRLLYERFCADVGGRGVLEVRTVTWPGDRPAVAFHRALGFEPVAGPGSQNLYGTTAYPDYDSPGEDRVVFASRLP